MKIRAAASVLAAGVVALGLAGCGFVTPQTTEKSYNPSDGVAASVGVIDVRDAMLITADGSNASLVVALVNTSTKAASLEVQYATSTGVDSKTVEVPASSGIELSPKEAQHVTLSQISAPTGSLFPVSFAANGGEAKTVPLPVLDTAFQAYSTLAPSPTPTPTPTPTPSESASPDPSSSASE